MNGWICECQPLEYRFVRQAEGTFACCPELDKRGLVTVKMNSQIDNKILYQYIQMAYDYADRLGASSIAGNRAAFLAALYQRRIQSVLFDQYPLSEPKGATLASTTEWFHDVRDRKASDIIVGRLDDFRIGSDGALDLGSPTQRFADHFHRQSSPSGVVAELGGEAYASYLPIHFFAESREFSLNWGIYISELGIMRLAAALRTACYPWLNTSQPQMPLLNNASPAEIDAHFVQIAYQILLRHEIEHFKVESFALNAELFLGKPLYVPYLVDIYAQSYHTDACLEEALANATVLNSAVIRKLFKKLNPDHPVSWQNAIEGEFFDRQPPGYSNYRCEKGWSPNANHFRNKTAGRIDPHVQFDGQVGGKQLKFDLRRLAMNYLCNQIVTSKLKPEPSAVTD